MEAKQPTDLKSRTTSNTPVWSVNHPWLSEHGRVAAQNLRPRDSLATATRPDESVRVEGGKAGIGSRGRS